MKILSAKGYNFGKIETGVMKLVLIIATVMLDNYIKFQSSTLNSYWEKDNFDKKLNDTHLPNNIPQSNNKDVPKDNQVKNGLVLR